MKNIIAIGSILLIMVGIGHFALTKKAVPKAELNYFISDTTKTIDPAKTSWNDDIRIALALWEGLAVYHPETVTPISGAATIPPQLSEDRTVYTFELREHAKWSNGDPVTANDFIYGWRRAIEPGTAHVYAFLIENNIKGAKEYSQWRKTAVKTLGILRDLGDGKEISDEKQEFIESLKLEGADSENPNWDAIATAYREDHLARQEEEFAKVGLRAIDDKHLEVTLYRPTAFFLDLCAFSTFLPIHKDSIEMLRITDKKDISDLTLWSYDLQWVKPNYHKNGYPGLVTNGFFKLSDWQFKNYMYLTKNENYWDKDNIHVNSILIQIITEASTAFLAYERGEVDWFPKLQLVEFADALISKKKDGTRKDIHRAPAFGTYFYYFNCQDTLPNGDDNPFKDKRVRMAFNLAVDKNAITTKVRKIDNPVATNFVPPNSIYGYSCPPGPDYNPEEAKRLLTEAGYPDGKGLPSIEILYNSNGGHEKTAQAVAEMWKNTLNVNVLLQGKEMKSFDEDKTNHNFMVCRASWYGDYGDPTTFLDMMITGNGQNDAAYSNPVYDKLMEDAANCTDAKKRYEILGEAERMLVQEEVPFLPIYYYMNLMALKENVEGIYNNARDMHSFKGVRVRKIEE